MFKKSPLQVVVADAIRLARPDVIIGAATSTRFRQDIIDKVNAIANCCIPDAYSSTSTRLEKLSKALGEYRTARVDHLLPKKADENSSPAAISDDYFAIQRNETSDPELAQELLVDALITSLDLMIKDLLLSGVTNNLTEVELNSVLSCFFVVAEIVFTPPAL
jgi:hypothetical protein